MNNLCKECIHTQVCGHKEKYQEYLKEMEQLKEKYDIFENAPKCQFYKKDDKINFRGFLDGDTKITTINKEPVVSNYSDIRKDKVNNLYTKDVENFKKEINSNNKINVDDLSISLNSTSNKQDKEIKKLTNELDKIAEDLNKEDKKLTTKDLYEKVKDNKNIPEIYLKMLKEFDEEEFKDENEFNECLKILLDISEIYNNVTGIDKVFLDMYLEIELKKLLNELKKERK